MPMASMFLDVTHARSLGPHTAGATSTSSMYRPTNSDLRSPVTARICDDVALVAACCCQGRDFGAVR
jgi:hypothetical protein